MSAALSVRASHGRSLVADEIKVRWPRETARSGEWPHTSLKRPRERRDETHRLLADGIDPAAKKKAERAAIADTFSALAREYLDTKRDSTI
jgi:hypothetical protein